jgi:hypothetical protein
MGTVNIPTKQIVNKHLLVFFGCCHRHHWAVVLLNEVVLSPPIVEWKMKFLFPLLIHIISIVCLFACFFGGQEGRGGDFVTWQQKFGNVIPRKSYTKNEVFW